MSLRFRLTLLYTLLIGGVFLLFGGLVYGLVNSILLNQVDAVLQNDAQELVSRLRLTTANQFDPNSISDFQTTDNVLFQVWGSDRRLQIARPVSIQVSLDEESFHGGQTVIRSVDLAGIHLRVYTVPLVSVRGPAGVLQVATNLALLDTTQRTLATVLIILIGAAMIVSAVLSWLATTRALAPLATVTQVAMQITRADDLSRRIPIPRRTDDEIGQLILAFNASLERLEGLFTTQRRFLADVSHELRTPLTVIKGNVGLMQKMGTVDPETLHEITAEVDRLTRLVGDLLLLAQAESGNLPLDKSPVELDAILLEVHQQIGVLAADKKVKMQIGEIEPSLIIGDRDRLKQVFVNLISNAVSYTPTGGQVDLNLCRVNGKARVTVSDTGPGIPEEDLPHIFERFYRGQKSRTRSKYSGFGLGLSIVYWIVTNHDGNIDVYSKPGEGTIFTVWLPLAEQEKED